MRAHSILHTIQRGVSFVEMIVTIAIVSMVMIGFTIFLARIWETYGFTIETGLAAYHASRGVDTVVEQVRKAQQAENGDYVIAAIADDELTIYTDIDNDGTVERARYFLDGTDKKLKVGVVEPDDSVPPVYDANTETISDVANYIVNNTSSNPVFEYYPEDADTAQYANMAAEALDPATAAAADVKMIKIFLHVNPDPNQAPENVKIQSFVTIRNISNYDQSL